MTKHGHARFWLEILLAGASGAALVITVAEPQWFERLVGIALDSGDGRAEAGVAMGLLVVAGALAAAARRTWRRLAVAHG